MTEVDEQTREFIRLIAENSTKLLNEVQRLHRDVLIVQARIDPFDDEPKRRFPEPREIRPKWKLKEALDTIDASRRLIEGIERDVGNCLGILKGIESDAISRAEMKPYLGRNRADD